MLKKEDSKSFKHKKDTAHQEILDQEMPESEDGRRMDDQDTITMDKLCDAV